MQFQFDANQDFQLKAIAAVVDLFEGQSGPQAGMQFKLSATLAAVSNRLDIEETALLDNLRKVQELNGVTPDTEIRCVEQEIATATGVSTVKFPNFSVEMETGTGKTYVYLRTVLELNRHYGMRKFIIVVPSVAIREGVLKTLKVTESHFRALYGNPVYRYYVYDSENLTQVRQFAMSDAVEVMVMTIDSFNKAANVLRLSTDRLQGETPIHLVQESRPILILDEPQNMESEKSIAALSLLNPLMALRYSATHRNPYNVVHRLTPAEAYRQNLVKKIEVDSVLQRDDENQPYLCVEDIQSRGSKITGPVESPQTHGIRRRSGDGRDGSAWRFACEEGAPPGIRRVCGRGDTSRRKMGAVRQPTGNETRRRTGGGQRGGVRRPNPPHGGGTFQEAGTLARHGGEGSFVVLH